MVTQDGITNLLTYAKDNLKTDRTGKKYVCPFCESGNKVHKTSALTITANGKGFKCHSCGRKGGIKAFEYFLSHPDENELPADFKKYHTATYAERKQLLTPEQIEKNREYIQKAQNTLIHGKSETTQPAYAYLRERGYTFDDALLLGIGFDPNPRSEKNTQNPLYEPALVIPYPDTAYYINRSINPKSEQRYKNPPEFMAGKEPVFNERAFDTAKCIVIVEGPFDALALETLEIEDIEIIPIVGASSHDRVLNALKSRLDEKTLERPPAICLMLDNDTTGRDQQAQMARKLNEMCVPNVEVDTSFIYNAFNAPCKDADEMRLNDPDTLCEIVEQARDKVLESYDEILEHLRRGKSKMTLEKAGAVDTSKTLFQLKTGTGIPASIPTGFQSLDEQLHGGLHTGLHVLCAGSSIGKTTLTLQIADYIASNRTPVLFYSIEQSARELISKSLSRLSFERDETKTKEKAISNDRILYADTDPLTVAQSVADIKSAFDNDTEKQLEELASIYEKTIQPYLTIVEPTEQPNANNIIKTACALKDAYNKSPVVFIDYLQLLAPIGERDSERQIVDKNLHALRANLARPLDTPVIIISSIGRAAYNSGIALESAKESGGIEFSADVFMGLQPFNLAGKVKAERESAKERTGKTPSKEDVVQNLYDQFRQSEYRNYTITINKNRNGKTAKADKIKLNARADYAYFEDAKKNFKDKNKQP